jgi:hypothetical protein
MRKNFTTQDVVSAGGGVASFDAAAGLYCDLPRARNVARDLLDHLMMKLENAHMLAYVCSLQCTEKSFDVLKANLQNMFRRIDIERLRDDMDAIVEECRDVSRQREEYLRERLCRAREENRELRLELDKIKKQIFLVGHIQGESWAEPAQDQV